MIQKISLLILVVVVLAMTGIGSVAAATQATCDENVIHSYGSGKVIGTPDRAQVTFSVQTENIDVKRAQMANAVQMTKVIDAIVLQDCQKMLSRQPVIIYTRCTRITQRVLLNRKSRPTR